MYSALWFGVFCTQNILIYIHLNIYILSSQNNCFLKYTMLYCPYQVNFFYSLKKTNEGKGMILMENDCIPVNRKILYNDSLNCKEKIALIILLDTEAGSISYDHLAQKMDVTKPTAIATIKSLKDKGFLKCNLKQNRKQNGRTVTNQYFVTI